MVKTFWQKFFPVTCVAVIMSIGVACSPDTAADPTPNTVTTTAPAPSPSVTTVSVTPTPAPTKTVFVTPTPAPIKPSVTKKPTPKPTVVPTQLTLYPMWEDKETGDPGGMEWLEVGATKSLHKATCNRDFRTSEPLRLNGTKEIQGSLVTVTATAKGTVIKTNLKATAFIFNDDAAARVPDVLWNRTTNPPTYTALFPKSIWEKTLGEKVSKVVACV